MRDDFPAAVRNDVSKRAGMRCSNPDCRRPTSGPQVSDTGSVNLGVAAHITAASPGGSRYDPSLSSDARASAANAIWLCQDCGKLIDSDEPAYSIEVLREWKSAAEAFAYLEQRGYEVRAVRSPWRKIEAQMPDLLREMRADLRDNPVIREFYLMHRKLLYNMSGSHIRYFYDDHPNLRDKIRILESLGLLSDITVTSIEKFLISEELADYLLESDLTS